MYAGIAFDRASRARNVMRWMSDEARLMSMAVNMALILRVISAMRQCQRLRIIATILEPTLFETTAMEAAAEPQLAPQLISYPPCTRTD